VERVCQFLVSSAITIRYCLDAIDRDAPGGGIPLWETGTSDRDILHAESFHPPLVTMIPSAEIDNDLDAHFFQVAKAFRRGLGSPIEYRSHFAKVLDPRQFQPDYPHGAIVGAILPPARGCDCAQTRIDVQNSKATAKTVEGAPLTANKMLKTSFSNVRGWQPGHYK